MIGLAATAFALVRVAAVLLPAARWWMWVPAGLALLLIPLDGIPLAGYARGLSGELSTTTILLLLSPAVPAWRSARELRVAFWFVAIAGVTLYPMALGVGPFDPYALGFEPSRSLLAATCAAALFAWWWRAHLLLFAILAAVLAHRLGFLESDNLWDYLLDPWVWAFSAVWLARQRFTKIENPVEIS